MTRTANDEKGRSLRGALLVLFLFFTSLSSLPCRADALSERGWQVFPRRVAVLKESFKGNYEREVVKRDYFILQKKVAIDNWIKTNGGDVLIVADEVQLNAPIDTRVYMRMTPDYWAPAPPIRENESYASLGDLLRRWPGALVGFNAFDSLYLWRDTYDPKTKMFVYSAGNRPQPALPNGEVTVFETAQLPSGQVPPASGQEYDHRYDSTRPTNGSDAPVEDVIWSAVRSGTIRIYASKITFCDECARRLPQKDVLNGFGFKREEQRVSKIASTHSVRFSLVPGQPIGDPFDVNQAIFLLAAGLKGGRGAAGSSQYGLYGNLIGMTGGLSGAPGRGGDAGSIEVHYVNNAPSESELTLIKAASSVDGGAPAQSHRQRTPSLTQIRANPTRSAFKDEVPVQNVESLFGDEGKLQIDSLDTDHAIAGIYKHLSEAEISGNYSIQLLMNGAKERPDLFAISPVGVLQALLAQELVGLQNDLIKDIVPRFTSSQTEAVQFSPFFSSLTCNRSSYTLLPTRQQDYLEKICEFRSVGVRDPVASYLFRIGGLFEEIPDVNLGIRQQQIISEVIQTQQLVDKALLEVKDVHTLIYDAISQAQRRALEEVVEKLKEHKKSLQDAYDEALKKQPTAASDLKDLAAFIKDMGDFIGSIYSSNYMMAALKFDSAMQHLQPLMEHRFALTAPDLSQIDNAIDQANESLRDFVALVGRTKSAILQSQGADVRDLILARERLEDHRTSSRFDFANSIRAAVQEYVETSDLTNLKKNLDVIRSTMNESNTSLTLALPSRRELCKGNPTAVPVSVTTGRAGCVEFDRHSSYVVVSTGRFAELPLLVVTSSPSGFITRSLEGEFDASELRKLPISEYSR